MLSEEVMKAIAEEMGEAVHELWMEKHRKERGWHSPEECPSKEGRVRCQDCGYLGCEDAERLVDANGKCERFTCLNCHTCMRPYEELSDSEKELDRAYPRLFLEILPKWGFVVVSKAAVDVAMAFVPKD